MRKNESNGLWPSHLIGPIGGTSKSRTYADTAKYVRNQLRPYSAESIINLAWNRLNSSNHLDIGHLQTWPWLSCLIVKITLENDSINIKGATCPEKIFNQCLNALWEAQAGRDQISHESNIWLQMRAMLAAQMFFQRQASWGFLRFPALINRLEQEHPSRILFESRFGMNPHTFMCISYAILAGVLAGKKSLNHDYYKDLINHFGTAVSRVFNELGRDIHGLRVEAIKEKHERVSVGEAIRPTHEYHEEPWLKKFPLLKVAPNNFLVWHPAVFTRGLESATHQRMSSQAQHYSNNFSKVFESYVIELLQESKTEFIDENKYKESTGKDKKSVEAIILQDNSCILIEAKLTAHTEIVNISGNHKRVWTGMKRIYEAMRQGWSVAEAIKRGAAPDSKPKNIKEYFLLIVTSQSMACASGEHFRRWFGRNVFEPSRLIHTKQKTPSPEQLELLPPEHIVIASIDEYEHLIDAIKHGQLNLPTMFREISKQILAPETSFMYLSQFLEKSHKSTKAPKIIESTLNSIHETLKNCLNKESESQ